jgi:hypothetical protein
MRKLIGLAVSVVMAAYAGSAVAAPVPGFEGVYAANYAACVLPDGTLEACEAAINAHVAALVGGGVDIDDANAAFTALRAEVFAANEPDPDFQAAIDALFELLLPDSGAGPIGDDLGLDGPAPAESLNPGNTVENVVSPN